MRLTDKVIKRPRGRPPTDKQEIVKAAAPRGRPPNKAATPNTYIIKSAPRGRPNTTKEVPPKEQQHDSIKTHMQNTESIVNSRQIRTFKTVLDIPKITEHERHEEKTTYKTNKCNQH